MSGLDALQLDRDKEDDDGFLEIVRRSISGSIRLSQPEILHIIHIDDWFDHKWMGFSGKLLGAVSVRMPELTIPPFHPNRVLNERVFEVAESGSFVEMKNAAGLHSSRKSETNTRLKLSRIYNSAVIAWYSGRSVVTNRAALMLYALSPDGPSAWYAGFEKREEWKNILCAGITKQTLEGILSHGTTTK